MTKNVYELTPFNIDNNKNISIKSYIDGSFFIEKAKANSEAFDVEFMSSYGSRNYFKYIWNYAELIQIIIKNSTLFNEKEKKSGLDNTNWEMAISNKIFPKIVDEAFKKKNYKTKVLFNNFDHPGISKCDICYNSKYGDRKGVGLMSKVMCANNEFNPNYDSDYDTGSDYIDCWVFIRANETKDEWKKRISKNT